MSTPTYQIFAIKYAQVGRKAWGNFVDGDPHEDWDMPLDYYVWAIVGGGRTFVVDTGFDAPMAKKRDRKIVHPVEEGLAAVGIRHADVEDVDRHAHALRPLRQRRAVPERPLPSARHRDGVRARAAACATTRSITRSRPTTSRAWCIACFTGRVQFHDGADELAPGITVHKIGGHTKGLQCVRVATERGPVVLASDATHFYAHIDSRRVFRVLYNQGDMLEGYNTLERLAGREEPRDSGTRSARARALSRGIREHGRLGCARRPPQREATARYSRLSPRHQIMWSRVAKRGSALPISLRAPIPFHNGPRDCARACCLLTTRAHWTLETARPKISLATCFNPRG